MSIVVSFLLQLKHCNIGQFQLTLAHFPFYWLQFPTTFSLGGYPPCCCHKFPSNTYLSKLEVGARISEVFTPPCCSSSTHICRTSVWLMIGWGRRKFSLLPCQRGLRYLMWNAHLHDYEKVTVTKRVKGWSTWVFFLLSYKIRITLKQHRRKWTFYR